MTRESDRKEGEGDLKLCWLPTKLTGGCGWRGYEREEKEGEREVDNLSTCGCVIQLYLWENTRFIEIREFGWGFFNADVIINIPPAFFSLQKSGLVRVYLTSVFLLLSVPRCFGDQKPQFD